MFIFICPETLKEVAVVVPRVVVPAVLVSPPLAVINPVTPSVLEKVPEVLESIAIGQDWDSDVRVVLFVKLREGLAMTELLQKQIRDVIRANTTPRHVPARIVQVADIPRTISGKIVELAVRNVVHGEAVKNTDALANPDALNHFRDRDELKT